MRLFIQRGFGFALVLGLILNNGPAPASAGLPTSTISGRVISPSGTPVPGATVVVQVTASLRSATVAVNVTDPQPFFGQLRIVQTNSHGFYQAVVQVPDTIPGKHLFAEVVVVKMSGPPFYDRERRYIPLSQAAQANFQMRDIGPYAAFVRGTVTDEQDGQRLRGVRVFVATSSRSSGFNTDGDGKYLGVHRLGAPSEAPTTQIPSVPQVGISGSHSMGLPNGIWYAGANRPMTLAPLRPGTEGPASCRGPVPKRRP